MKKGKPSALLPIAVFLVFYLGFGIYSEYILKIPMGFYNIPIVVFNIDQPGNIVKAASGEDLGTVVDKED